MAAFPHLDRSSASFISSVKSLASQPAREPYIAIGKCLLVNITNTQRLISVEFNRVRNDFRDLLSKKLTFVLIAVSPEYMPVTGSTHY